MLFICVFFFKQKTAYEMRISDWSSDVCSSDLDERSQATGSSPARGSADRKCRRRGGLWRRRNRRGDHRKFELLNNLRPCVRGRNSAAFHRLPLAAGLRLPYKPRAAATLIPPGRDLPPHPRTKCPPPGPTPPQPY